MDSYLKYTKWTPGAKYNITQDWSKNMGENKGKFMKAPKVTFTANIINSSKKRPGPTSYSLKAPIDHLPGYAKN